MLLFLVVLVLVLVSVVVAVFEPVFVVFVAVAVAVVSMVLARIRECRYGKAAYEEGGAEYEGQALLNDLLHGVLLFF